MKLDLKLQFYMKLIGALNAIRVICLRIEYGEKPSESPSWVKTLHNELKDFEKNTNLLLKAANVNLRLEGAMKEYEETVKEMRKKRAKVLSKVERALDLIKDADKKMLYPKN